jgi:hypothetical protein
MLGYFLFTEKSALIFTKQWVGLQFGCFLRKLIWSPWLYPNVWATSFNSKSCALISTKNGSATVWAIFSQTHPVTLACIPKIPIFVLLWKALESELWFMSWPFGLFCDNLVEFMAIWYFLAFWYAAPTTALSVHIYKTINSFYFLRFF